MAVTKKYDLAVKTGTYLAGGETKNRYQNVGAVMEGDNGMFVVLNRHFNPAGVPFNDGRDQILISCFEPKARDGQPQQRPAAKQEAFDESDTPF